MESMIDLLGPLIGAVIIGVFVGARGIFGLAEARVFSRFVFTVAMPIAVFDFMRKSPAPDPAYAGMISGYLIAVAAVSVALFVLARRFVGSSVRQAGAVVFTGTCSNSVFLGLPIAIAIPGWGGPFVTLMVFEAVFVYAVGASLMTWPHTEVGVKSVMRQNIIDSVMRTLKNPIVIGAIAGLMFALSGTELPDTMNLPIGFFAVIASPFGLFVLGLYLVVLIQGEDRLPTNLLSFVVPLKLVVLPILAFGLVWLFSRNSLLATVCAFFTGLPPAVASVVFAATYKLYEHQVAAIVVVASVFGFISMAVFLTVFAAV